MQNRADSKRQVIELRFPMADEDNDTAYPTDGKAISLVITPVVTRECAAGQNFESISFRVAFEADNPDRKEQPYRNTMEPIFPDCWKPGEVWNSDED